MHDAKAGYKISKISDLEDVNDRFNSISNMENQFMDEIKLSLCSSKIPRQFSTPSKDISPNWKKNVMYYANNKNWSCISEKEKREWEYKILNCSSEDLENCCFPSKCFASGSDTFVLRHRCISLSGTAAYANEVLNEIGIEQNKNLFVEYIYIHSRYLLRHMNRSLICKIDGKKSIKTVICYIQDKHWGNKSRLFQTLLRSITFNHKWKL